MDATPCALVLSSCTLGALSGALSAMDARWLHRTGRLDVRRGAARAVSPRSLAAQSRLASVIPRHLRMSPLSCLTPHLPGDQEESHLITSSPLCLRTLHTNTHSLILSLLRVSAPPSGSGTTCRRRQALFGNINKYTTPFQKMVPLVGDWSSGGIHCNRFLSAQRRRPYLNFNGTVATSQNLSYVLESTFSHETWDEIP